MGSSTDAALPKLSAPVVITPSGGYTEVTEDVYAAIVDFKNNKHTGSVQIHFRDGGIAGVEANYKKSYNRKNQNKP